MLRVSRLTDYATVVLAELARTPEQLHSATALAGRAHLEAPTVSKVLKQLAHAGLVDSQRGAAGGYRLARPADQISVAAVVAAIEGPIGMTECSIHSGSCDHEAHCGISVNWQRISAAIETALGDVSLADMLAPPTSNPSRRIPARVFAD